MNKRNSVFGIGLKVLAVYLLALAAYFMPAHAFGQARNFAESKKTLKKKLDLYDNKTLYCGCDVTAKSVSLGSCGYKIQSDAKRANRMEFEHVVPAHAFGQSFLEWRVGTPECAKKGKGFKGRKCAATNAEFAKMEADVYNLFPEIGELNGLRSNYSMAELPGAPKRFGKCLVKLEDGKFEPSNEAKGVVARTYLHMESKYPGRGIVSNKNRKLFEAWDKMYPVSKLECARWKALKPIAGYEHLFAGRCK